MTIKLNTCQKIQNYPISFTYICREGSWFTLCPPTRRILRWFHIFERIKDLFRAREWLFKKSEDEKIFAGQESFGSLFHIPPLWGQRRRLSCDQASFWGGGGNQINSLGLGLLCQQVGRGDIKLPHLGKCNSLKVSDMEIGLFAAAGHPS